MKITNKQKYILGGIALVIFSYAMAWMGTLISDDFIGLQMWHGFVSIISGFSGAFAIIYGVVEVRN